MPRRKKQCPQCKQLMDGRASRCLKCEVSARKLNKAPRKHYKQRTRYDLCHCGKRKTAKSKECITCYQLKRTFATEDIRREAILLKKRKLYIIHNVRWNKERKQARLDNPERYKLAKKKMSIKTKLHVKNLDTIYIRNLLRKQLDVPRADIPQSLIELKREVVQLNRFIKKGQ